MSIQEKCRVLFVTCNNYNDLTYGGGQCSYRNLKSLRNFAEVISYRIVRKSAIRSLITMLYGFYPPTEYGDLNEIENIINKKKSVFYFSMALFSVYLQIKLKKDILI